MNDHCYECQECGGEVADDLHKCKDCDGIICSEHSPSCDFCGDTLCPSCGYLLGGFVACEGCAEADKIVHID